MQIRSETLNRGAEWQKTVKREERARSDAEARQQARAAEQARKLAESALAQAAVDRMESGVDALMKLDNIAGHDTDGRAGEVQVPGVGRLTQVEEGLMVTLEEGFQSQAPRPDLANLAQRPSGRAYSERVGSGETYIFSQDKNSLLCEFTDVYLTPPSQISSKIISAGPYPGVDRDTWYEESVSDRRRVDLSKGTVETLPPVRSGVAANPPRPKPLSKPGAEPKTLWQRLTGK